MNFNKHSHLEGLHAFLSASKYHWINYDDEKLRTSYIRQQAAKKGTELHEAAAKLIQLGVKLPKEKKTLNLYVNDAIKYKMKTEQILFYSDNCFGTADAISFQNGYLRIHDFKSGFTMASMNQPRIYAALFCLEYGINPIDITIELRLYQLDKVVAEKPEPEEIINLMDIIVRSDEIIEIEKNKIGG